MNFNVLKQLMGVILLVLALGDIYLTVLHPRIDSSLLSSRVSRWTWQMCRAIARFFPKKRNQILSHCGSAVVLAILAVWVTLLILGFTLINWTGLGTAIQAGQGETPTDFITAIYYSGFSLTTLGTGDLTPQTSVYRLLTILQAVLGFSVFTLSITYILSVYSALTRRNIFALSLHHQSNNTADSVELLTRLTAGNDLNNIQQDLSNMARDLIHISESQNTYSVLLYFRFRQYYYALPRIMYLSMDVATLIKSALDAEEHRSIIKSAAVTELWCGGLHLLDELCYTLVPKAKSICIDQHEERWRNHYYDAIKRLHREGIQTVVDPDKGAAYYIELRHQWEPYLSQLITHMEYERCELFQGEY